MECFLYEEWMDDKNHPKRVTRETNDKKRKKENPNGKQRKGYLYLGSSARERERERERETHTTKPTAGLSSFTSSGTGGELSF